MATDAETLLAWQQIKRRLGLWRLLAVLALAILGVSFLSHGTIKGVSQTRPHIARVHIDDNVIFQDIERDEMLAAIAKDKAARALIVHINSPGGTVVGGETLYKSLLKVGQEKPVVALMGEVATSAAYMAALAGERIFAHEGTITGSIGVLWETADITGLLEKLGVSTEAIKSGPLKAVPSPLEPLSPEGREATRGMVLDIFDMFIDMVALRRHMPREGVLALADGRVFTGRQAAKNGLVDELGGEDEARAWLAATHGLSEELPLVDRGLEDKYPLWERLITGMAGAFSEKIKLSERLRLDGLFSLWHPLGQ